jgi:2-polyprenyl-6-hydroxyphenyl methylase/3-demethylubiquinone-9 3-methyltransferase
MTSLSFDFGRNWEAFSNAKVDAERLYNARRSLQQLIGIENIESHTLVDVGCGSGLFSIGAAQLGATRVVGFDVNPTAVKVSKNNLQRFRDELIDDGAEPHFCTGNVLDTDFLESLGTFDVVYAWGVLHHTGTMWQAIRNVASLVKPDNGIFVLAICNQHWTSFFWKQIKRLYNLSPYAVRWLLNYIFGALIYIGVWVTTRGNPLHKERGMDFWYDVIDWLGGYPYEYADRESVVRFVQPLGFQVELVVRPRVPTGCNEFVLKRSDISLHG